MISGDKKYQGTALVLLVMLAINIVVPSTLLAVNLYCQGNSPGVSAAVECCNILELNSRTELSDEQIQVDFCTFEQACKQEISDPLIEHQTLLPEEVDVYAALTTSSFLKPAFDNNLFGVVLLNTSISFSTPSIFLLNSTFLN